MGHICIHVLVDARQKVTRQAVVGHRSTEYQNRSALALCYICLTDQPCCVLLMVSVTVSFVVWLAGCVNVFNVLVLSTIVAILTYYVAMLTMKFCMKGAY